MIRLVLEMPDEVYEQLRKGIGIGFLTFSLDNLKDYKITVGSVQHYSEECND